MLGNLQHIQVAVRCRPLNDREKKANSHSVVDCNEKRREILACGTSSGVTNTKTFTFDKVFGPMSRQIDVYNQVVKPVVMEVIEGYNCTIFAYGQTGTGKTYTMEGEPSIEGDVSYDEDPHVGIIPRSVNQLFQALNTISCEYSVKISFIELYNEELSDLLSDSSDCTEKLRIFDDPARKGSVVIPNLEEIVVQNKSEVYKILKKGAERRRTAATLMNSQSSRSHSIFTVTVFIKEKSIDGEEAIKIGKLNLVDLAGSENIERSGAVGKRAAEAGKINKSLTTLGRVITALVEHRDHIPYRESNLTRLLQDSLGGRTKTSIIATISPAACNIEETLSTLDYAHKAKSIKNKPEVNQKLVKKALIKEYTEEIERLKRELFASREKNGIYLPEEIYSTMECKLENQKEEIRELLQKINALNDEVDKLRELFNNCNDELSEKKVKLKQTSEILEKTTTDLVRTQQNLDENSYLLNEQVKTEKVLYKQADDLLKLTQTSLNECNLLYEKLSRKSTIEANNQLKTNLFTDQLSQRNDLLCFEESQIRTIINEHLVNLNKKLLDLNCRLNENKEENSCTLMFFTDKQYNWHSEFEKIIDDLIKLNLLNCKQAFSQQNSLNLNCTVRGLSCFSERHAARSHATMSLNKSISCGLDCLNDNLIGFFKTFNYKTDEFENAISHINQGYTKVQLDYLHPIEVNISNSKEEFNSLKSCNLEFFNTVTFKMNELNEYFQEKYAFIKDKMDRFESSLDVEHGKLKAFNKGLSANNSEFCRQIQNEFHGNFNGLMEEFHENASSKVAETSETCKAVHTHLTEDLEHTGAFVGTAIKTMEMDAEKMNGYIASQMTELEQKLREFESNIKANKKDVIDSLNDHNDHQINETHCLLATVDETIGLTKRSDESFNKFCDEVLKFIQENTNLLDNFKNKELKTDISTGSTPKRQSYTYPMSLARTRPHQTLLEDYRENVKKLSNRQHLLENNQALKEPNSRSNSLDSLASACSEPARGDVFENKENSSRTSADTNSDKTGNGKVFNKPTQIPNKRPFGLVKNN